MRSELALPLLVYKCIYVEYTDGRYGIHLYVCVCVCRCVHALISSTIYEYDIGTCIIVFEQAAQFDRPAYLSKRHTVYLCAYVCVYVFVCVACGGGN